MDKWTEQNGKIIASRVWVMTEAWAIVRRFKKLGQTKAIGDALKQAWRMAKMEISVQVSVRRQMDGIANLAKLGNDRLIEMSNDIENIDRHSAANTKRLSDIRAAMRVAG